MSTMAKMRAQMAASSSRSSGSRQSPIRPSSPVAGESSLPASAEQRSTPPRPLVVQWSAPPCPPVVQESAPTCPPVVQESAPPCPPVVQESAPPCPPVVQESAPPCPPAVQNVNNTSSQAPTRPMTRQFSHVSSNALTPGRLLRSSSALSRLSLTSVSEPLISSVHKSKGEGKRVDPPRNPKSAGLFWMANAIPPRNAATSADKKRRVDKESSSKRKGRK